MDPKQFWLETNVRLKPQEIKVGTLLLAVKTFTTFMIILRIGSGDNGYDNHRYDSDEIYLNILNILIIKKSSRLN